MNEGHRTSSIPRPRNNSGGVATRSSKRSKVPSRGAATRSRTQRGGSGPPPNDTERPGLLDDFTTPIPFNKQIVHRGRGRLLVGAVGLLIALAIGAALFVLPVKSWMRQRDDLKVRTAELTTLDQANTQLQTEVDRLQTEEGIREAARTEIDYVPDGAQRTTVLPKPAASTALPAGWPYNLVSAIIAIRQADAVATVAAASSSTTGG